MLLVSGLVSIVGFILMIIGLIMMWLFGNAPLSRNEQSFSIVHKGQKVYRRSSKRTDSKLSTYSSIAALVGLIIFIIGFF